MPKCAKCKANNHGDCDDPHGNDSSGMWIIYCCCGIGIPAYIY